MPDLLDRLRTALAGRYRIDRELGRGGMAIVFLAHDERHGRAVALKVLRPDLAWSIGVDRFLREIQIAAGLTHPHILPLFDSGEIHSPPDAADGAAAAGPLLYYVMPYVAGESLRQRLDREQQLPVAEATAIARQAAAALAHAHARGIIHRDIKPENVLLEDGEAVIADFGIARAVEAAAEDRLSEPGMVIGTPAYMSPEQASGGEMDGRSDIYSLGCVLYEMLTGGPPFHGVSARVVLARHAIEPPPALRTARATVDASLEQAVLTALAKSPADRFATAADFARALGAGAGEGGPGRAEAGGGGWRGWGGRRVRALVAVGAAVGAIAGAAWMLRSAGAEALDPRRIVVLPMTRSGTAVSADFATDATIALDAALNSTPTLRGIRLEAPPGDAADAARDAHAAYALSSRLIAGDSLRLVLTLHAVNADTSIQRVAVLGADASAWQVGVRAASQLLPVLIQSGGGWDLSALETRVPRASAAFLLGERAYRNARFTEALERFRGALEIDSAFTLAAIRGALAALWADDQAEARALAERALADTTLAPWHAAMARGLAAYGRGEADSAAAAFRRAATASEQRPEGWMALGEAYTHLLPAGPAPDSVAKAAFLHALEVDSAFLPAMPHLIEAAVRRGDTTAAAAMLARFAASRPDSAELWIETALVRCARRPLLPEEWRSAVLRHPREVNTAAYLFSVGGLRQPLCAEGAWRAMLVHDTTDGGQAFHLGALVGLHGVLVATGRTGEALRLLDSDTLLPEANRLDLILLHASAVAAPAPVTTVALRELKQLSADQQHSIHLWFSGIAEARLGRAAAVQELAAELARRAGDQGGTRLDSLLAGSLRARYLIAAGDTAAAIVALDALRPTGGKTELAWLPWEGLAGERMALARLLMARGDRERAIAVASTFDAPAPIVNLIYLPESLRLRERAARELGLPEAREYRSRILALGLPAGPRGD